MQTFNRTRHWAVLFAIIGLFILGASAPPVVNAAPAARAMLATSSHAPIYADKVVSNAAFTCALTTTGEVYCWGDNAGGQLGNSQANFYKNPAPLLVTGLPSSVIDLTAGFFHMCALLSNGGVRCWGRNNEGQLGNGSFKDSTSPVTVSGLSSRAVEITAGAFHTCARFFTGAVYCWGDNQYGQLATAAPDKSATPLLINGLPSGAISVATSAYHNCAMVTNGEVYCWGINEFGQLGNESTLDSLTPVKVEGLLGNAIAISAGVSHTCALLSSASVQCWGRNNLGQLGLGHTNSPQDTATDPVLLGEVATAISTGSDHTCATLADQTVKCWGWNAYGQLGDGSVANRATPVLVNGLPGGLKSIAASALHTCGVLENGVVMCWGDNHWGQLGDGTHINRLHPVTANGFGLGVVNVAAGANHTCALLTTGRVRCWGINVDGQLGDGTTTPRHSAVDVVGLSQKVIAITAGSSHTCALLANHLVQCWGRNVGGQLGNGTFSANNPTPGTVQSLGGPVLSISAGSGHTCGVLITNLVQCWGWNNFGQLGNNSTTNSNSPVLVQNTIGGILSVSAGSVHTCIMKLFSVQCWGGNFSGQLGTGDDEDHLTAVTVIGLGSDSVIDLVSGDSHNCVLLTNNGLKCWGNNGLGQAGFGNVIDMYSPVSVSNLTDAIAIGAGFNHNCALRANGTMVCWGWNNTYQLGDGSTTTRLTPVAVQGLQGIPMATSAGIGHTCAVLTNGDVRCWGYNITGQVGDGSTDDSPAPLTVQGLMSRVFLSLLVR